MFGGWTAAILLRAVLNEAGAERTPSALTVHYLKQVAPGCDITVRVRMIGGGRSLSFWCAELSVVGQEDLAATATVVLAKRRDSDGFTDVRMPEAADPGALSVVYPPGSFGERSLMRPVTGNPPFDRAVTRSLAWVRETSARSLDYVQLAYLLDNYAPRVFLGTRGPRPYSTVTMTVFFHASEAELRELGDDYILIDAMGSRAESSTVGANARLWSRNGLLLATTEQLGWFK